MERGWLNGFFPPCQPPCPKLPCTHETTLRFSSPVAVPFILSAHAERLAGWSLLRQNILAITDAEGEVLWSHETAGLTRAMPVITTFIYAQRHLFVDTWTTLQNHARSKGFDHDFQAERHRRQTRACPRLARLAKEHHDRRELSAG